MTLSTTQPPVCLSVFSPHRHPVSASLVPADSPTRFWKLHKTQVGDPGGGGGGVEGGEGWGDTEWNAHSPERLLFCRQVFHQVLDVPDLHRVREGNVVRTEM